MPNPSGTPGGALARDESRHVSQTRGTTAERNFTVRVAIARGPSTARLSDALVVDFDPHRGDLVLGGAHRFEGIQGTERIRCDLGRALCDPCALFGSVGVNA